MDAEDRITIAKAINAARKAYDEELKKEECNPAYYPLNITIYELGIDYIDVLHVLEDKQLFEPPKTEVEKNANK